jgi:hypothetical protein
MAFQWRVGEFSLSLKDTSGFCHFSFVLLPADTAAQHGCHARNGTARDMASE